MSEFNRHALGTVAASAIGLALAFGTVIIATFGLFLIAMNQEFGWGMGRAASLLSVAALAQAPLSPLVGRFIDRIGVRRVVLPGIVLYGASIMALSLAGRSPVQLYVLFLLVGATSSLVTMLPYSKAVSAWFSARRGLMLSVYGVGAAILGSAVPQAARRLIDAYGWRGAYLGLGFGVVAIGLPVLALLLREPASGASRAQAAPPPLAVGMTAGAVRSSPIYWRIILAITLCSIGVQAIYAHMAPLLVAEGLTRATATNALSLYALASIAAQLAMGGALDGSTSPRKVVPFLLLSVVGMVLLHLAATPVFAVVGGVLLGATVGAEMSLAKFLHSRYFGNRAFGEVFGLQFLFIGLSAAIGPASMGLLRDATGGYGIGLLVFGGLIAVSVGLLFTLPPYDAVRSPLPETEPTNLPPAVEPSHAVGAAA